MLVLLCMNIGYLCVREQLPLRRKYCVGPFCVPGSGWRWLHGLLLRRWDQTLQFYDSRIWLEVWCGCQRLEPRCQERFRSCKCSLTLSLPSYSLYLMDFHLQAMELELKNMYDTVQFIQDEIYYLRERYNSVLQPNHALQQHILNSSLLVLQGKRNAKAKYIDQLQNGVAQFSVASCFVICLGPAALAPEVILSKEEAYLNSFLVWGLECFLVSTCNINHLWRERFKIFY